MRLARVSGQFFGALIDHVDGWRGALRRRPLLVVPILLLSCIAALPLGVASLPDALWIGGIYDWGDYDNLVAASSDVRWSGEPFLALSVPVLVARLVAPIEPGVKSSGLSSELQTRSPPSF
jgi:hypothetical protein